MIYRSWNVFYFVMIEIIFGGLLILPLYPQQLFHYFFIAGSGCLVFIYLITVFNEKGKILYLIMIVPLILLYSTLLQPSFTFLLVIVVLVFWRGLIHFKEFEKDASGLWLFFTVLLGVGLLIFPYAKQVNEVLYIVSFLIGQCLFILVGSFLGRWILANTEKGEKKKFLYYFSIIISGLISIGIAITLTLNLLKWIFFTFLEMAVSTLAFIVSPVFSIFEDMELKVPGQPVDLNSTDEGDKQQYEEMLVQADVIDPTAVFTALTIAGLIVFVYFLYKRNRENKYSISTDESSYQTNSQTVVADRFSLFPQSRRMPVQTIRKEIYLFERYAEKLHLGRGSHETLSEWLKRIGLKAPAGLYEAYDCVRYGEMIIGKEEEAAFLQDIKRLRHNIKELSQKNKKERKSKGESDR